ncbi:ECF transporter S component [Weissella cibaria]|jgi:Predicted membrane protein|uniref:Riboflavin transporter n=1 Tax=Weissella cibaria TaxID=137591 RepID=A0A9Q8N952_9LACO|nr:MULTISPECIES: ECF transporter S component [Weissella]APS27658.1 Riboflavin transporter RibU [Weissella cibaria]APU63056.1 Riboflavin transporter RibU [Weissella cibaria]APU65207.1 Riboflavin transporter RibU [Weissella cibaria]ASS51416.1 Riboflavin transporter RibU [Weissella cibaria]AVO65977.1 ECF transporter S component [Weissella cibaria]
MNKTRRLTVIALLAAISFVLMVFPQFPLIPGATFLKIDFSFVPVLIGALMLDLKSGYAILILRSLLKVLLNNSGVNDYIGLPMNIVAMGVLLTVIMLMVGHRELTVKRFIAGSILGTVGLTLAMVILNYVYAVPLYAMFANFDIKATIGLGTYLLWMVIPFNLIEGIILTAVAGLVFVALRRVITNTHSQLN